MAIFSRNLIGRVLLEAGLINKENLQSVLEEEKSTGRSFGRLLIEKGLIDEEKLLALLEKHLNIARVDLLKIKINPETIKMIPPETARRYQVIPLKKKDQKLYVAMNDPLNLAAVDDLAIISGADICPVLAERGAISKAIDEYYQNTRGSANQSSGLFYSRGEAPHNESAAFSPDLGPAVRVVNDLIERAIKEGASDIHFEPSDDGMRIRMRLDGVLHDLPMQHRDLQNQIISRVKIMASLDIAEKRLPQDGNIQLQSNDQDINLRVSTMPTIHGEKVVIRLLEKERIVLPLEELGFSDHYYRSFMRLLLNQAGMVLVTGPTGCGKTTTLYSALNFLNRPEENIVTVEDPVECRLKGINQIQINRRIDRTFANTLRSILRQDPDIIMIGEIRDLETAKIATQAALTGHLVLSTLHTNNAAGAVTRLVDMGLEPYLVTASLTGVIAQRLIRIICPHCKTEHLLTEEEKTFYFKYFKKEPPAVLYKGGKCNICNQTGYRGRTSIQELLLLNQDLNDLIIAGVTAGNLQDKAVIQGMQPLVVDGLRCLEEGITTLGEVVRTTFSSVFDTEAAGYAGSSAFITQLQNNRD